MRSILFILCSLLSLNAAAYGYISGAKVVQVRIDQGGQGMITFDKAIGGGNGTTRPGCVNAAYINMFSFNTNTAAGRAIMAMALAAKATGSPVEAVGLNACTIYSNIVEDISYGIIQ